jgi:hypothetical protein
MHPASQRCIVHRAADQKHYEVPWVATAATQAEYYEAVCQDAVAEFLASGNCDSGILAYGATGSGKTFTTQGPRRTFPLPCAAAAIDNEVVPEDGVLQRALAQVLAVCLLHTCPVAMPP